MQFRLLTSLAVFIGSYLPLGLILLVQDIDYQNYDPLCWCPFSEDCAWIPELTRPSLSIPIFLIPFACFIIAVYALYSTRPRNPINIINSKYIPAELMSYTLPYVVSFMSLEYQEAGKFFGLIVFLLWMFWITHRSGQLLLNPIFVAFGWRLHEISYKFPGSDTLHQGRALVRGDLVSGKQYTHALIQDVVIIKDTE